MIPEIAGFIVRREGKKFLKLEEHLEDSRINSRILQPGEELSLYIHIPFCRKLCPFCCFNRYLFQEDKARRYFASLRKELDIYIRKGFTFSDFYFGGGTPTILMDELLAFIDYLKLKFPVKEISLETTPAELTPEKVALLKEAGVRRLSLGVQSFDDEMLKAMSRLHCTGKEAQEKILLAQGQFPTVNVDLIFDFPFQTLEKFSEDIAIFKKMGIDQVTFYPLMPSPHKKDALERKFAQVNYSLEKKYYDLILSNVFQQGFQPSTVWCFSNGRKMIDEYIVTMPTISALAPGQSALVSGYFYVNSFSLDKYAEMVNEGQLPIVGWRKPVQPGISALLFFNQAFRHPNQKKIFSPPFRVKIFTVWLGIELNLLKLAGVIQEKGNEIVVTTQGMYTVNVMMREFFASLNTLARTLH